MLVSLVVAAGSLHGQLVITDSVQTYTSLTNTTVTLNGKSELHITGTSAPLSGSIIHLNSHDSWFWMDNVRPSVVSSTYLAQIRVNGAAAVHGSNVRIVQYGNGTVVTPFTNSEQPLETFTNPGFRGTSQRFGLYTYFDSAGELGAMQQNISSFKLKRGFMATFATESNGRGVSKVYIAQDHDLELATLPGNLDNSIRFIRVFPWRWVSKKGSCDVAADTLDAAWFYNWNNDRNSTLNWEYVPIKQQRWWPANPTDKTSITHFSGYNEPDNPVEDSYQTLDNGSRTTAIAAWPELLECGLRMGAPAVTDGGKWWLFDFMDRANAAGLRVDYIPVHFYQCGMSAPQLKAWLQEIWDRYQKPIWVTEFNNGANWTGCGDPTYTQNADVIASWIDMMDNTPWIERYAVYSNVESTRNMVYTDGSLTPAGAVYKANQSPIGYQQESYPLAVKRGVVHLPFESNTRDNSGNGNTGVSYGAPEFITGHTGQALQLDGSNRYVKLPPGILNSSTFTFAAWVNWDGGASAQRIFDFGNNTDQFLYLSPGISGQMRLGLRNGSGVTTSINTSALPIGSWQHVAVTMQGSAAKLYLNGVLQVQGTLPDQVLSGTASNFIGKSQWPADPLFDGRIDEVVITDFALNQSQIAGLMTGPASPFIAHWRGDIGGNWSTQVANNTNWSTDATGAVDVGQLPADFCEVNFSSSVGNPSNTVLGANFSIDSLVVSTSSAVGIGGTHDLTLGAKGLYVENGAGAVTISTSGKIHLAADQTWTNHSSNLTSITSGISGGSRLNVTGTGRIAFQGSNDWSGDLSVLGGGIVSTPSISNAFGTASQVLLGGNGSSGTLVYTGSGETTSRSLTFQGGFGAPGMILDQSGTGLLKFTSALGSVAIVNKTLTLQGSTSGVGEISNTIPNNGSVTSLVKIGTGKWIVSGANTYSGSSSLVQGTLAVGHNSAMGSGTVDLRGSAIESSDSTPRTIANPLTLSSSTMFSGNANLLFTGAVNAGSTAKTLTITNSRTEFSGVISGTGNHVKSGPGTLVLSGSNTYTGATTVSAGTLVVTGSLNAASTVGVAGGATLAGSGTILGPVGFSNASRLAWNLNGNGNAPGDLKTGAVAVANGAVLDLTFNAAGSTVNFENPFWSQIQTWPILTSSDMTGVFALGNVSTDSMGNSIAGTGSFHLQQTSQGVILFFAPEGLEPPAAPSGLIASASSREVSLSWNPAVGATQYLILRSTNPGGPYATVATVGTPSYSDSTVLDGITYYYAISAVNPNGTSEPSLESIATPHLPGIMNKADNTLALHQGASWSGGIVPSVLDTANWTGLATGNSVMLGSNTTWHGLILGVTGGPVSLSGPHTLTLGNGGISMATSTRNLAINTNLALAAGNQIWNVATARNLALTSGSFSRSTGSTVNFQGAGTISAALVGLGLDGTSDTTGSGGMMGTWASVGTGAGTTYATLVGGNVTSFAGATTSSAFGWPSDQPATTNYQVAGVQTALGISRTAHTIRYTGAAGTQVWGNSGANVNITLNGLMNAGSGILTIARGGTGAGSGVVIGGNQELILHAANAEISVTCPIYNNVAGNSALTIAGPGNVALSGANAYTGPTTIGSGSLTLAGGNLGSGAVRVIAGATFFLTSNQTLSQQVSGSGAIQNNGATVTLSGNFSGFSGTYTHNSTTTSSAITSTLAVSKNAAYHLASAQGSAQGILTNIATGNHTFEFGSLSGVANSLIRNGASVTGNTTLRIGNLNTHTQFAGIIGGGGGTIALEKTGIGTLTLTGTSAYTGATRINRGTLMLNGTLSGNSPVEINSGGTLAGTGSSNGPTVIQHGGTLAPGSGFGGVLSLTGNLTLNHGSVLGFGIGTTSSRLALGGSITSSGSTIVNLSSLPGFATGTYPLITGAGSINAANFTLGTAPPGYVYLFHTSSNTLFLTIAVPPQAPESLTAIGNASNVALNWSASPGATHYQVKRSHPGSAGYEILATVPGTTHSDTSVTNGVIYTYVITAWNAAGESNASIAASAGLTTNIVPWRHLHFGTTENTGTAADGFDADHDGLSNLLEYALASDPNVPSLGAVPELVDPHERLTLAFTRNMDALDIVTSVWGTDDLSSENWQELARGTGGAAFSDVVDGSPTGALVTETGSGALRSVIVSDRVQKSNPAHSKRFLKIQVHR